MLLHTASDTKCTPLWRLLQMAHLPRSSLIHIKVAETVSLSRVLRDVEAHQLSLKLQSESLEEHLMSTNNRRSHTLQVETSIHCNAESIRTVTQS